MLICLFILIGGFITYTFIPLNIQISNNKFMFKFQHKAIFVVNFMWGYFIGSR